MVEQKTELYIPIPQQAHEKFPFNALLEEEGTKKNFIEFILILALDIIEDSRSKYQDAEPNTLRNKNCRNYFIE